MTQEQCRDEMLKVSGFIYEGANTFLLKEYTYLTFFCVFFAGVLFAAVDMDWSAAEGQSKLVFPYTTVAFLVGAATSMGAGFIGMRIATTANVKTTYLCNHPEDGMSKGFDVAFQGGQVLGFCLVGLALLILEILLLSWKGAFITGGTE